MRWAAFDVANNDKFTTAVREMWARTYWPCTRWDENNRIGDYQIVRFVGERVYYIREATKDNDDYSLGQARCWPKPFKTLTAAKAAVEMLLAMQGITRE